jgi:hypothetical protein
LHDLGNILINNLELKAFSMWVLCCPKVDGSQKFGVW